MFKFLRGTGTPKSDLSAVQEKELLRTLAGINGILHSSYDPDGVTTTLLGEGAAALGCDSAAVSLRTDDGWRITHLFNMPTELIGVTMTDDQERHAVIAFETGEPVAVSDPLSDPRVNREHLCGHGVRSVLVLPLIVGVDIVGVIFFNFLSSSHEFTSSEMEFGRQLAVTAGIALRNATLVAGLREKEEALTAANAVLKTVLASVTDGLAVLDKEWRYTFMSERGSQIIGMSPELIVGKSLLELFPKATEAKFFDAYLRAVETGLKVHVEDFYPEPLNIWLECHCYPSEVGLTVYFHDITKRKEAEIAREKLALEFERQYRAFDTALGALSDFVYYFDREGRFKYVNKPLLDLWGMSLEQSVGKNFFDLGYPNDLATRLQAQIEEVFRTGERISDETPYTSPTGEGGYFEYIFSPIYAHDGTVEAVGGSTRDITWRKQTEDQLRASQQRVRLAADAAELGIWVWDLGEDRVWWENDRPYEIFGLPKDSLPANASRFRSEFVLEEDIAGFEEAIETSLELGSRFRFVGRIRRPDSELRWIELTGRPIGSGDQPPQWMHGTVADVTERVEIEGRLHQQTRELEDQSRRKDQFLAMLSHELRNPLAPIKSAVQLLKMDGAGQENSLQDGAVETIERQVDNMTKLIADLLEMSRVVSGRLHLEKVSVDLCQTLEHALQTVEPQMRRKGHHVDLQFCEGSIWTEADALRLEEVFVNLLANAAKYTPDGGIISISCRRVGEFAVTKIVDNGVGISPELLPRIFDLFTQADQSLDRSEGGLGIGLSLARRLVELHGGTIIASSPPDQHSKGSEFTVTLRLSSNPQRKPETPALAMSVTGLTILVVEDNADLAKMLTMLLTRKGFQVRNALNGPAGLAAALEWRPKVMLLDIGLPGMDGFDVAKRVRDEVGAEIFLIALTGYGNETDVSKAMSAGFDAHLTKPFEYTELERLLALQAR